MDLTKTLNAIGRAVFVKYFYVFMNMPVEDCLEMFTEDYTEKSKKNRINNAKKIFREELQRDALRLIFNSPKVNAALRKHGEFIWPRAGKEVSECFNRKYSCCRYRSFCVPLKITLPDNVGERLL